MQGRIRLLAFTVVLATTTGAIAPTAAQDRIGIYFDPDDLTMCADYPPNPTSWQSGIYLILTDLTATCGIVGLSCRVDTEGDGAVLGAATILHDFTGDTGLDTGAICIGFAPYLPWAPVLPIAEFSILVLEPTEVRFFIRPNPACGPAQIYCTPAMELSRTITLTPTSGHSARHVAVINGDCSTPGEIVTWGRVKALYR
ncbi:MAG: hypothetical protein ABIF77_19555 [bacterium]